MGSTTRTPQAALCLPHLIYVCTHSITRGDLEGHKGKVLAIPGIVFVAGVVRLLGVCTCSQQQVRVVAPPLTLSPCRVCPVITAGV